MAVLGPINYETYVKPYEHRFCKIVIPNQTISNIKLFTNDLIRAKQVEQTHQIDNNQEFRRFYTGLIGEAALEILLGIPIIDWNIGNSKNYNTPDIQSLGIGIKTVEYGKFPIIFKKNEAKIPLNIFSGIIRDIFSNTAEIIAKAKLAKTPAEQTRIKSLFLFLNFE